MRLTAFTRTIMATAVAVATAVAGVAGQAEALEFGNGDLVLALYGNSTEYLRNLGTQSSLLSGSTQTTINIDPAALTAVGGTNNVNWALYGFNCDAGCVNPTTFVGGTTKSLSAFTPTEIANSAVNNGWIIAAIQSGQLSGDGLSAQLIAASNPNSFTSSFGTSNTLGSSFPVSTAGSLGGLLNILSGNFTGGGLSQLGTAILAANGSTLTIQAGLAAVPIPAAVVLFGSGLIGLVGVARRSRRQYTV